MLDNTLTLPVDVAHDSTFVDEVYTRFDEITNNRTLYVGADNTPTIRNQLMVTRNDPSRSGNFLGVYKTSLKFTQDIEVPGVDPTTTNVAPILFELNASLPIGFTAAEAMHLRQRIVAAVNHEDFITRLTENREI
jgi:hypothetical protein